MEICNYEAEEKEVKSGTPAYSGPSCIKHMFSDSVLNEVPK